MLINFTFKNCRSFYQKNVFSMQATNDSTLSELNTFKVNENLMNKGDNELIKSAVIFGSNASGKSNLIKALFFMRNIVLFSASQFPITSSNETFAFYDEAKNEESSYEVELIENDTYYKYGFSILNGRINKEWLDRRKERLIHVFKRTQSKIEIVGLSNKATGLINISPFSLFLSVGNNFQLDIASNLKDVIFWFRKLLFVFDSNANMLDIYDKNDGKYRRQALEILKMADIGIKDIKVKKDKVADLVGKDLGFEAQMQLGPNVIGQVKQEEKKLLNIDMETVFSVYDKNGNECGTKNILLFKNKGFNSEGTERLIEYLGFILASLDHGNVILIDEIDSRLHFLVADYILRMYNSIDKNPHNAQLICTAHNVLLMDNDLRRDQIYFTSKDAYGESSIVSLADYKNVRKADLFSKKYLAGFYSKIPDMINKE